LHVHDEHQLTWAEQGVLLVRAADRTWALPRSRALWIPGGVRHSVLAVGRSRMLSLWVIPQRCPIRWAHPTLVAADGLVSHLVAHLITVGDDEARRALAERLLWDLLDPVPAALLTSPMPSDEGARRVAEGVRDDVTDRRVLGEWEGPSAQVRAPSPAFSWLRPG